MLAAQPRTCARRLRRCRERYQRLRLAKAGYLKGLVLDWRQGGFGPNKTMFYKAGPALMAGSPPPPQEDADALH